MTDTRVAAVTARARRYSRAFYDNAVQGKLANSPWPLLSLAVRYAFAPILLLYTFGVFTYAGGVLIMSIPIRISKFFLSTWCSVAPRGSRATGPRAHGVRPGRGGGVYEFHALAATPARTRT